MAALDLNTLIRTKKNIYVFTSLYLNNHEATVLDDGTPQNVLT